LEAYRLAPDIYRKMAFPAETAEALLEGHMRAFAYFGGVPTRILYDNTKIAVARILGGASAVSTRVQFLDFTTGRSVRRCFLRFAQLVATQKDGPGVLA
jgi:transposase